MKNTNILRLAVTLTLAVLGMFLFLHSAQSAPLGNSPQLLGQAALQDNTITVTTTIQAAINLAQNGDEIYIPPGTYTESLVIDKDISLRGLAYYLTIIQPPANQRGITATGGHTLHLTALTVTGGHSAGAGGGIYTDGSLSISICRITNNSADYGGGVFQESEGVVHTYYSDFIQNSSTHQGGGIYATGDVTLMNTNLISNTSGTHGGGLHVQNGWVSISGGLIQGNTAANNGAGVNANNDITVYGTSFVKNSAGADGGGLLQWNLDKAVYLDDDNFQLNRAHGNGGGVWARGNLTVTNTTVISNTAGPDSGTSYTYGGGLYLTDGSISVGSSTFRGNKFNCQDCFSEGGGLYIDTTKSAKIQSTTIEKNYAWVGGGVYYNKFDLLVQSSVFKSNTSGYAGALLMGGGTIQETDFLNNDASRAGGAIRSGGLVQVSRSRFINNSAHTEGGGAISGLPELVAVNTLFIGNHSDWGGSVLDLIGSATSSLEHTTIASPAARDSQPAIELANGTLLITNTIITNFEYGIKIDSGTLIEDNNLYYGSHYDIAYVSGVVVNGGHSLQGNPLFVNPAAGDYHLRTGSPAINAGKNLGVLIDLDGLLRSGLPDIGAYEFGSRVYLPLVRK